MTVALGRFLYFLSIRSTMPVRKHSRATLSRSCVYSIYKVFDSTCLVLVYNPPVIYLAIAQPPVVPAWQERLPVGRKWSLSRDRQCLVEGSVWCEHSCFPTETKWSTERIVEVRQCSKYRRIIHWLTQILRQRLPVDETLILLFASQSASEI